METLVGRVVDWIVVREMSVPLLGLNWMRKTRKYPPSVVQNLAHVLRPQ